jgi:serine/threonine-protein kinase RsbW
MADQLYQLSLKSTYEEAESIPEFVEGLQKETDLDEDSSGKLMLLLSEAVTNAIVHGNNEDPSKKVEVEINIKPDSIITTVEDEGEGYDPDQESDNPLNEENLLKEGGRGIFLIEEISDEIEYFNEGRGIRFVIFR